MLKEIFIKQLFNNFKVTTWEYSFSLKKLKFLGSGFLKVNSLINSLIYNQDQSTISQIHPRLLQRLVKINIEENSQIYRVFCLPLIHLLSSEDRETTLLVLYLLKSGLRMISHQNLILFEKTLSLRKGQIAISPLPIWNLRNKEKKNLLILFPPLHIRSIPNFAYSFSVLRMFLASVVLKGCGEGYKRSKCTVRPPKRLLCKERKTRLGTQNKSCESIIMSWCGGGGGCGSLRLPRKVVWRRWELGLALTEAEGNDLLG